MLGERGEVLKQAALRRPRIIRACDQVAVDRPGRRFLQSVQHLRGGCARQAEAERHVAAHVIELGAYLLDQPFELRGRQRQAFARCRSQDQTVDRTVGVVPDQAPQRQRVKFAIAEGGDERKPEAAQLLLKVVHGSISLGTSETPETEQIKTPHSRRGSGSGGCEEVYRAHRPEVPERGAFFEDMLRGDMTMPG